MDLAVIIKFLICPATIFLIVFTSKSKDTIWISVLLSIALFLYLILKTNKVNTLKKETDSMSMKMDKLEQELKSQNEKVKTLSYKYSYILKLYPHIEKLFEGDYVIYQTETGKRVKKLFETVDILEKNDLEKDQEIKALSERVYFLENSHSNLKEIPFMAKIISDYETYNIEVLAKQLDWGYDVQRLKKVASIREIRHMAQENVEKNLAAKYNLEYLLQLFPVLSEVIEHEYSELPLPVLSSNLDDLNETYDNVRNYLTKDEYNSLSSIERNQLALDRYKNRSKSKWQIGRDYELYVGHIYEKQGYTVDYTGSFFKLEDLGRDLIASKGRSIRIIQCKNWAKEKVIHEKYIFQLFGTTISYKIENEIKNKSVKGVFVTTTKLSDVAKRVADILEIEYIENFPLGEYPCIKCNIGKDEFGYKTYIYHLPFDQQYDKTKTNKPGEFMAYTVKEAEQAGFRRALKWFGNT